MIIDEQLYQENGIPFISGNYIDSNGNQFFFRKEFMGELTVHGVLTVDSLQSCVNEISALWKNHPDC